jgi:hypothetical protein
MFDAVVVAIAWQAGTGVEPLSRAFWIHQAVAAVASLLLLWAVATLARHGVRDRATKVIPFPRHSHRR